MTSVAATPSVSENPSPAAPEATAESAKPRDRSHGAGDKSGSGTAKSAPAKAKVARPPTKSDRFAVVMVSTTVAVLVALAVGRSGWFTPGDDIGYYLGLVGGVMMLLLLSYPLRKYLQSFRNLGKVKDWFAVHMVLGIAGPVLVLAHSTFHMRSTNAAVALICMVVVAASGIVGRFLYIKVHKGLYGEKLNLQELQKESGLESAEIRSRLHFAPKVEKALEDFQKFALEGNHGLLRGTLRMVSLSIHSMTAYRVCANELKIALSATAAARGWDADKYARRLRAAKLLVKEYLGATQRVAQFSTYDRLLALWHVAHVPLVYLLVISAIAHVVAVHMY